MISKMVLMRSKPAAHIRTLRLQQSRLSDPLQPREELRCSLEDRRRHIQAPRVPALLQELPGAP